MKGIGPAHIVGWYLARDLPAVALRDAHEVCVGRHAICASLTRRIGLAGAGADGILKPPGAHRMALNSSAVQFITGMSWVTVKRSSSARHAGPRLLLVSMVTIPFKRLPSDAMVPTTNISSGDWV